VHPSVSKDLYDLLYRAAMAGTDGFQVASLALLLLGLLGKRTAVAKLCSILQAPANYSFGWPVIKFRIAVPTLIPSYEVEGVHYDNVEALF
jgi:hypothetical protein